jgi:hypothetical protein
MTAKKVRCLSAGDIGSSRFLYVKAKTDSSSSIDLLSRCDNVYEVVIGCAAD